MSFDAKQRTFAFTAKVRTFGFTAKTRVFAFTAKTRAIVEGYIAMLLKTGQTTSYVTGDDGDLQKGVAKSYTVLTTDQYAGTTNIVLNAKTDVHSNNCVKDNSTGLMWSRYVSASVGPNSDGLLPWTTNGNGEGIFAYCDEANGQSLAGYNDWRVPNDVELASLRNMEAPNALPNAAAFPGWPPASVWSSTTRPDDITRAMWVAFQGGNVTWQLKTGTTYCALVRG